MDSPDGTYCGGGESYCGARDSWTPLMGATAEGRATAVPVTHIRKLSSS